MDPAVVSVPCGMVRAVLNGCICFSTECAWNVAWDAWQGAVGQCAADGRCWFVVEGRSMWLGVWWVEKQRVLVLSSSGDVMGHPFSRCLLMLGAVLGPGDTAIKIKISVYSRGTGQIMNIEIRDYVRSC